MFTTTNKDLIVPAQKIFDDLLNSPIREEHIKKFANNCPEIELQLTCMSIIAELIGIEKNSLIIGAMWMYLMLIEVDKLEMEKLCQKES